MQIVGLSAVPSQTASAALGGQSTSIAVYQLGTGCAARLYMDLSSNGTQILTGRMCKAYGNLPSTRAPFMLTGRRYRGFQGDFVFLDSQLTASQIPVPIAYTGLGARWQLMYLSLADLEAAGLA